MSFCSIIFFNRASRAKINKFFRRQSKSGLMQQKCLDAHHVPAASKWQNVHLSFISTYQQMKLTPMAVHVFFQFQSRLFTHRHLKFNVVTPSLTTYALKLQPNARRLFLLPCPKIAERPRRSPKAYRADVTLSPDFLITKN